VEKMVEIENEPAETIAAETQEVNEEVAKIVPTEAEPKEETKPKPRRSTKKDAEAADEPATAAPSESVSKSTMINEEESAASKKPALNTGEGALQQTPQRTIEQEFQTTSPEQQ
jgi:hypothetical protein